MSRNATVWLRILLFLMVAATVAYALRGLSHVLRLLVLGGLLAYLLDPLARSIESRGFSRRLATALICTGLLLLLAVATYNVFPVIAAQLAGLQQGFDVANLDRLLEDIDRLVNSLYVRLGVAEVDVPAAAHSWIAEQSRSFPLLLPDVVSLVTDVFLIPFVMFFLLRDGPDMKRSFISWVPNRYFEFALTVIHKSSRKLSGYLRGQATAAFVVGALASLALWLIGVDYYLVVGLFAGLANMIPYFGPFAGAVVAVSVSALTTGSFDAAPWIIAAFASIQVVDNTLVQPLVLSRNVQMHPLAVLIVVIAGGQFFGLWGLLLAVPATAIAKVAVSEFFGNLPRFRLQEAMVPGS